MNINEPVKICALSVKLYLAYFKRNLFLAISVAISMLLFLAVALYLDFDYATTAKNFDKFQDNYIVIDSGDFNDIDKFESLFLNEDYFVNTYCNASSTVIANGNKSINVEYNVAVTENLVCGIYFNNCLFGANDYAKYERYEIICGHSNFTSENELIVSEEYADLIAGSPEAAINKEVLLDFGEGWGGSSFKIVGVYKQTLSESRQNKDYLESYRKSKHIDPESFLLFDVFVSPNSVNMKTDKLNMNYTMYLFYDNDKQKHDFESRLTIKQSEEATKGEWNFTTCDYTQMMKKDMRSSLISTKALFMAIVAIICGLNIFGTMANSIADRKKEIGIKKALGASDGDIMFGFIVENMINIFLAIIFAVSLISILALIYGYYQRHFLFVDYVYEVYPETVMLFITFSISSILGFSLIPAYKASQVNVIDTIRIE